MVTPSDLELRARACYQTWKHDRPKIIAVDTETSGLTWWDEAFCVTLAWMHEGKVKTFYWEIGLSQALDEDLWELLVSTPELVMHNAKFDMHKLINAGFFDEEQVRYMRDNRVLHDTQAMAHLLDEHQKLGLKGLARDLLGIETVEETAIKAWFKSKKIKKADQDYSKLPREILIPYAEMDVDYTLRLFNRLYPKIVASPNLKSLYEMEMDLTFVLIDMEQHGMGVDVPYVEKTAREYALEGQRLELHLRKLAGDEDFNPNSPEQVKRVLVRRGINAENTRKETLAKYDDDFTRSMVSLRRVRKIHGSYLVPLLHEQRDGIVHPWIRQHGTHTGRMSAGSAQA